jgi:hypothetical protein
MCSRRRPSRLGTIAQRKPKVSFVFAANRMNLLYNEQKPENGKKSAVDLVVIAVDKPVVWLEWARADLKLLVDVTNENNIVAIGVPH